MILVTLLIFLMLLAFDLPDLLRHKKYRELAVYLGLSALALAYMIQYTLGVEVFSPIRWLSLFFQKTLGLNYALWQGHS